MRYSYPGSFHDQATFLRRQFLQDGDLPFTDILTDGVIAHALAAVGGWLDRIFSPLVTLWVFLGQVLSADHSCRAAVARLIAHRVARGQRWVTLDRAKSYGCRRCGHVVLPWDRGRGRPQKYGWTLCGWVAYATVALRVTTEATADVLGDLFGVRIQRGEVCRQRGFAANRYRATYEAILAGLRAGPVVHADETWTQTKRPVGRGYVWVFANPTAAAYVYSPTRDGDTVRDALAGFRGVLVSDFYGGYEGVDCPQQKCLVHLARDLNDELVKNPFDEDLKGLAAGLSALLQAVVRTIDRHGLKAHFLGKHKRDVERFYDRHVEVEDGSAAAG